MKKNEGKPLKLSPKKGGNGYVSSYTVSIGVAELRNAGLISEDGTPFSIEKIIDEKNHQIIIRKNAGE